MEQVKQCQNNYEKAVSSISTWIVKYLDIPYRHLGTSLETGIDCYNLCATVIRSETEENLNSTTADFCDIASEDWYKITHYSFFDAFKNEKNGFKEVDNLQPFDIILMSLGSTHVTNHCALYLGQNKILQTMTDHPSRVTLYGKWYQRYTTGKFRWKNFNF